jgi:hypothetical protein
MASFLNVRSGKAGEGPQRMTLFPFPMKLARGFFRMGMKIDNRTEQTGRQMI